AVAVLQHVLLAVVDALAIDADVAPPARVTARQARRRVRGPLGHHAEHDGTGRAALDQDFLAQPPRMAPAAARACAHALVMEEERAVALGDLDRRGRDVAGPREHVLA